MFSLRTWYLGNLFTTLDRDFLGKQAKALRGQPLEGLELDVARELGQQVEDVLAKQGSASR